MAFWSGLSRYFFLCFWNIPVSSEKNQSFVFQPRIHIYGSLKYNYPGQCQLNISHLPYSVADAVNALHLKQLYLLQMEREHFSAQNSWKKNLSWFWLIYLKLLVSLLHIFFAFFWLFWKNVKIIQQSR